MRIARLKKDYHSRILERDPLVDYSSSSDHQTCGIEAHVVEFRAEPF